MASSSSHNQQNPVNKFPAAARFGDKRPSEVKRTEYAVQMALKQDVDSLARKFLADQPVDFSLARFGRLFGQMEFATIFLDRFTNSDLVEFSENLFHYIASTYMFNSTPDHLLPSYIVWGPVSQQKRQQIFPSPGAQQQQSPTAAEQQQRTEQERIFGIFLIYCLYFMQPLQFVIPVFATAPQLADLHQFMSEVLLPSEQFEALYCLYRLIQSNAFAVHAFEDSKFNPLLHRHFELLELGGTAEFDVRQLENLGDFAQLQGLASDPQIEQVQGIHQSYMETRLGNRVGLQPSSVLPTEGPQQLLERLLQETQSEMERTRFAHQFKTEQHQGQPAAEGNRNSSSTTNDQLPAGEGESGAHPKTVLSRRNRIRQMAYSTEFGSTRRDRRHRSVTAAEDADEQQPMNIKQQPVSPAVTPSKGKKQQNRGTGMEVKQEAAEAGVGGGQSPGKKQPKRRRSRSRTLERELDPATEAILREIEAEPIPGGDATAGPSSSQPTISRKDTLALQQEIQQIVREEEQTEQLWQRILAAGTGAPKGKGKK